tara:strand:- start:477 stop:782 length:306 start_codon:yes stop_codon:yes gene_type:complete
MSVSVRRDDSSREVTIAVQGTFDFSVHRAFREAYESLPGADAHYVVDLAETETMDSAALGMLLLLRDYAGGENADIRVQNCSDSVREILRIASFELLFTVS